MTDKIDLHTHSTASDGSMTPSEVAKWAKENGLSAVALTDHDAIRGLNEFKAECKKQGIEGISGVEISAEHPKKLHIVGLYIDETDENLVYKLAELRRLKGERNREVVRLANENGMDITVEDLLSQEGIEELGDANRVHISNAMIEKDYAENVDDAFKKYLVKGRSCYVKRVMFSPEESIRIIKDAGGIAIMAHASTVSTDYYELYAEVKRLKEIGLDGIECYYNDYSEEFSKMCIKICDELDLLKSGGSDFHGENKVGVEIGKVSTGYVPYSVLQKIKEQRGL